MGYVEHHIKQKVLKKKKTNKEVTNFISKLISTDMLI